MSAPICEVAASAGLSLRGFVCRRCLGLLASGAMPGQRLHVCLHAKCPSLRWTDCPVGRREVMSGPRLHVCLHAKCPSFVGDATARLGYAGSCLALALRLHT